MSVFVLGGAQTDFALKAPAVDQLVATAVTSSLSDARVDLVETIHVGNAFGQLYNGQGHLGALPASLLPELSGVPAMRHEAACASGGLAVLSAMAEIEAGRYDVALVLGVEQERCVPGDEASRLMRAAAWVGHEDDDVDYVWPYQFALVAEEYDRRYGLDHGHLAAIAELNYRNARDNPNAQTRGWTVPTFGEGETNPIVAAPLRRTDCSQVTDGAAAVVLASSRYAEEWARRTHLTPAEIKGWGHRTVGLPYAPKVAHEGPYLMPHVRETVLDSFRRAGVPDVFALDGLETHDCFTSSEYLAIDHVGITQPGESWKAVESGALERDGALPVNPSGGLIGGGHPVGATGVRMVLDATRQVTGRAGGYQVEGARTFATLNFGGSTATTVTFVIGV